MVEEVVVKADGVEAVVELEVVMEVDENDVVV